QYGQAFEEYAARVPLFWPRLERLDSITVGCSWKLYRRNGEYQSAIGVAVALALLCLKVHAGDASVDRGSARHHAEHSRRDRFERGRLRARVEPPRHEDVRLGVVHREAAGPDVDQRGRYLETSRLGRDDDPVTLVDAQPRRVRGRHHHDVAAAVAAVQVLFLVNDGVELAL